MSGEGIRIVVKTEQLKTAAERVRSEVRNVRKAFAQLETTVNNSSSYWQGKGNQEYKQVVARKTERVNTALTAFEENAVDLEMIAGIYEETESSAVNSVQAYLPEDVII